VKGSPLIVASLFGLALSTLVTPMVNATDIAREVRVGATGPEGSNSIFLELGLGVEARNQLRVQENPDKTDDLEINFELTVSGGIKYRGFFAGFTEGSFDGLSIGYNLYTGSYWSYDLLLSSFKGEINSEYDEIDDNDTDAARERKLLNRDTFYNGFGLRATNYYGDNILQFRLVTDIHKGKGYQASARIGRHSQLSNWNVHAVAGLVYDSSELGQYLWGVSAKEATERFPEYKIDGGVRFQLEFGGLYPLSRDWVFRSLLRYTLYSSNVADSPLIDDNFSLGWNASVNYVF